MSAKKQIKDGDAADDSELDNATADLPLDVAPQGDAQPKMDVPPKPDAQRKPDAPKADAPKPDIKPAIKPKSKVEPETSSAAKPEKPKSLGDIMKVDLKVRRPRRR
jgi:hypothetical protein